MCIDIAYNRKGDFYDIEKENIWKFVALEE